MRGGGHKDPIETKAAGFLDKRSYIRLDGKQFLFGLDIANLRLAVFQRDGYRCCGEREDGERCNREVNLFLGEMHHVIARGKGGDDSMSNVCTLCASCHRDSHVRVMLRWIS